MKNSICKLEILKSSYTKWLLVVNHQLTKTQSKEQREKATVYILSATMSLIHSFSRQKLSCLKKMIKIHFHLPDNQEFLVESNVVILRAGSNICC